MQKPQQRIALVYFIIASLWILFSDTILFSLGIDESLIPSLNIFKGIAFVATTTSILYLHLHREFNHRFQLESRLEEQIHHVNQSREAVAQSEARFRKAVEEAPLPILIFAEDGEILSSSQTWLEITGYTTDQLQTIDSWTELAYGERKHIVREVIDKLFDQNQRVDEGEFKINCADGKQHIWEFSSTPLGQLPDGRRTVISMAKDLTDRKKLEDALNQTNKFLQMLIQSAPLGIITFDPEGIVSLWNPAMEELLGWSQSEVIGNKLPYIREQDQTEFNQLRQQVAQGQTFKGVDVKRQHKDGRIIDLNISAGPLYDSNETFIGVVGLIKDITERKHMENALRESELRVRQIAENIREVFYLNDAEKHQTLYISPAYEKIWGRSCESLYQDSRSFLDAIHPDDRAQVASSFDRQHHGEETEVTYRVIRPDKSIRWVRSRAFPVFDDNHAIHRIAGIAEDITDRLHYQNRLKRVSQRLVTVLDDERARIARELHDQIGQELTAIGINLGIIEMHTQSIDAATTTIQESSELVSTIIERIRVIIADLRPLALDEMGLLAALRWYSERFTKRTRILVTLESALDTSLLTPVVNNTLYQITTEALTNVAKHAHAHQIWISIETFDRQLKLIIRDDGVGFNVKEVMNTEYKSHWGIQIMQERISTLVGSHLYIESTKEQGTAVIVEVQL